MKINDKKIVKRWNSVMFTIGCEHVSLDPYYSELEDCKDYYGIPHGISIEWLIEEAKYWLSCYYEGGNCRCDDRFIDKENYKIWVQETGILKRLIARLEKMENIMVVEW